MKKLLYLILPVIAAFSFAGCDPVPNTVEGQVFVCASKRPYNTGQIYWTHKIDSNSLKCWHRYDGCRTYQLEYAYDNWQGPLHLTTVSCPQPT